MVFELYIGTEKMQEFQKRKRLDFKLKVRTGFNCAFGHKVIVVNLSGRDDARVTGILADGPIDSGAPALLLH